MSHLGPDAQRLLARTKHVDDPSLDDRARMRSRLDTSWARGEIATDSRVTALIKGKLIVGACSGLLLLSWGAYRYEHGRVPARVVASAPAVSAPALPQLPEPVVPASAAPLRAVEAPPTAAAVERAVPARVRARGSRTLGPRVPSHVTSPPSAADAPVHSQLAAVAPKFASRAESASSAQPAQKPQAPSFPAIDEELSLLGAAQDALQGGHPSRALQLVQEHAFRFPRGALARERLSVQSLALCALGRKGAARQVYADLAQRAPGSAVLARVRADCGFE